MKLQNGVAVYEKIQSRTRRIKPQQTHQRSSPLAKHQPQQYDHEVLILGFREPPTIAFDKVIQVVIQAYNGDGCRTPSGFQRFLFTLVIPHGVLFCDPAFQNVKT